MPKVSVRDIEIHYQEQGSGFPFILIHGLKGKYLYPDSFGRADPPFYPGL